VIQPTYGAFILKLPALLIYAPLALSIAMPAFAAGPAFVHPGLLSTQADFDRMKLEVGKGASPWIEDWKLLQSNPHDSLNWKPKPETVVVRGASGGQHNENYPHLYNDIAAAYADCLDWKISGDTKKADKALQILNAWSSTLSEITGTNDKYLASGIYGYQMANDGEILRSYPGWSAKDFKKFQNMMIRVFYPMNRDFLAGHNGSPIDHYWANWDLANDASMLAIGVVADRRDIYDQAAAYYLHGAGNGALRHLVWKIYDNGLGQWQESGRDQGHTLLGIGLAGVICQMAWSQGDDLFGADDNRFLKGAEYVAKYNLGNDVPYTSYSNSDVEQKIISPQGRGEKRPVWDLVYNHYVVLKRLDAPYLVQEMKLNRPEGGGGDYGPNSGGYDSLGYGTLLYALAPADPDETH
jgi:hypothetical protein